MTPRRITTLCSRLRLLTDDPVPGQRIVYAGAVSARFPAHQVNGIWHTYEEDDLAVMAALGLRPKTAKLSSVRRVTAAATSVGAMPKFG